jgi:hypothetical protein
MSKFKVGDRVRALKSERGAFTQGEEYTVGGKYHAENGFRAGVVRDDAGVENGWSDHNFELVSPTGPVVTETVKRIVPGVYGRVVISPHAETSVTHVGVTFEPIIGHGYAALSAPELRAAAAVLTQLADALEDK